MPDLPEMPAALAEVAQRCREETDRFFRRLAPDTRYCYELFRRALGRREAPALEFLIANYTALVDGWVRRHPGFPNSGEDSSLFVTTAFEKLWIAVSPARFSQFPDLKALLSYLKLCAHSGVVDHLRSLTDTTSLDDEGRLAFAEPAAPEPPLSNAERSEIWEVVLSRAQNEKERLILHACFSLRMKPAEVIEAFPGAFESVTELYRVKQNLLERLRRDQSLLRYLAPYA